MQEIRDTDGSDSDSSSEIQDPASGTSFEKARNEFIDYNLVRAANKKIRLYNVLKNYKVHIVQQFKNQVWSTPITCPFPSHKGARERTPSFGYNFVDDRSHCFGCKKSGRAVEFIAEMESRPYMLVAQSILDSYSDSELVEEFEVQNDPRIDEILFSVALSFRTHLKNADKNKIKKIEKIIWWWDSFLYLRNASKSGAKISNISVEEMQIRSDKVVTLLSEL